MYCEKLKTAGIRSFRPIKYGKFLGFSRSYSLRRSLMSKNIGPIATFPSFVIHRNRDRSFHKSSIHSREDNYALPTRFDGDNDALLTRGSADYVDTMYEAYLKDPNSVHLSWRTYFQNMDSGKLATTAFIPPPTLVPTPTGGIPSILFDNSSDDVTFHLKVQLLVRAYQVRGHTMAKIDPLNIKTAQMPQELRLDHYNFTEQDLDKEVALGVGILRRFKTEENSKLTLREIIAACEKIYCGSIGIEYVHIADRHQCDWLRDRLEIPLPYKYSVEEKHRILDRLIWSDTFERFLATKYPNDKRFGLEGCESLIPGLKATIDASVEFGVEHIVIGMPHRGRLNVLSNVVRKPNEAIFSEFAGTQDTTEDGSGDVKYHLGMNYERPTPSGKRVNLYLVANPSHLEAENPVVLGRTRALQQHNKDAKEHKTAMGLLLHGDAAFAAQGIVYETLCLHGLPGYSTGGTIHVIVNNQIGFTTDPRFARSTPYCTDLAKSIEAPIVHVNGDDVEALNFVCQLAAEWRATYKKDFVIDIVCYRKHGHNETDQPSFTQPLMYRQIAKKESILARYQKFLVNEGSIPEEEIENLKSGVWGMLENSLASAKDYIPTAREWLTSAWEDIASPRELARKVFSFEPTYIGAKTLKEIGKVISTAPNNFHVHKNLQRILNQRGKSVETGQEIDFPTGEALAFGSLLLEGHHIRVSGQDVERGTFSQRHAVLHDQENENTYVPLNNISNKQAEFTIYNSPLSEFGVLGFDYGYSLSNPLDLVMWEAQFGDFSNNAQCIIDQFICSAESKWHQRSNIVLSLPHGYDGQGPEHSNAHIERYLSLCNEPELFPSDERLKRQHQDCNIFVVYPTQPSNVFHMMRRQLKGQIRKPLIHFFSKSLLRHPLARSNLKDFTDSSFQLVLEDQDHKTGKIAGKSDIKTLAICTGQVWAKICQYRESNGIKDLATIRIEQLHPWPYSELREILNSFENVEDICLIAEEPENFSAIPFATPRVEATLANSRHANKEFRIVCRAPSSSIATGSKVQHKQEEDLLMSQLFMTRKK